MLFWICTKLIHSRKNMHQVSNRIWVLIHNRPELFSNPIRYPRTAHKHPIGMIAREQAVTHLAGYIRFQTSASWFRKYIWDRKRTKLCHHLGSVQLLRDEYWPEESICLIKGEIRSYRLTSSTKHRRMWTSGPKCMTQLDQVNSKATEPEVWF